jgi:ATP-dependent protease Clp ATPase subunit
MVRRTMHCSFCGRRDSEVAKLVAGPPRIFAGRVYICDRCAAQTIQIMEADFGDQAPRMMQSLFRRTLNRLGASRHHDASNSSECHAT